jgi:uncharacterized membrane protein YcaP (DUF421 family)
VVVALGSVAGGVPLRPNSPFVAVLIAVMIILSGALLVDVAYAHGWAPAGLVVGRPVLLYANGEAWSTCVYTQPARIPCSHEDACTPCSHDHQHTTVTLALHAGHVLHHKLRRCLLAPDKLASECRVKGHLTMQDVYAIVLEPSGTFSVISKGGRPCWRWRPLSL